MVQPRNIIKDMKPYVPGKPIEDVKKEFNLENVIKLASNENPLGCSNEAKKIITSSLDNVSLYPDGNATCIRSKLSKHLNIKENQLIFGAGSDEIITMLMETYLNPGDEVLTGTPSFPRYQSAVQLMEGNLVEMSLIDNKFDLVSMQKAISTKTKIILIANPNNPTGTIVNGKELINFIKQVPSNILIILDEAYFEYAINNDEYIDTLPLVKDYDNIILLRTFSKVYGLASLRIGYGISNEKIIDYLNRVRGPFNVTTCAQKAACASLDDNDFVKNTLNLNNEVKEYTYNKCKTLGLSYIKTYTNFIMIDTKKSSEEIFHKLQQKGIIIRPGFYFGMNTYLRVTFGTMQQMQIFFNELEKLI